MDIILLKRITNLGNVGDIVKVKAGYARNFLIPSELALKATEENKKVFEEKKLALEAENLKEKKEAENVLEKLNNYHLSLFRQAGESGNLFGSVKAKDLAEAFLEKGFKISKFQFNIATSLKTLGVFPITVSLHPEVIANILINVARNEEHAKIQYDAFLKENEPKDIKEEEQKIEKYTKKVIEIETANALEQSVEPLDSENKEEEATKDSVV